MGSVLDSVINNCLEVNKKTDVYVLRFMDEIVAYVNVRTGECEVICKEKLPFNLRLDKTLTDFEKRDNFRTWCANRTLSLTKTNSKRICNALGIQQDNSDNFKMRLALSYRCLSLDDAYWTSKFGDDRKWDEVSLHLNKSRNVLTPISLCGKMSSIFKGKLCNSSDLSVNGTFAKSWIRDNEDFQLYLCKADESSNSNETVNEVYASGILESIGANVVKYKLDIIEEMRVSKSRCFTTSTISFIPFKDFKRTESIEGKSPIEYIKSRFKMEYANMVVASYIIGNEDLHDGNWGLLLDNNSFTFIGLCPLFDFNYAFSDKSYCTSHKAGFIPECFYVDVETGMKIEFCDDILELEGELVFTETLESAAIREFKNCSLDLNNLEYPDCDDIRIDELSRRVKLLKSL